MHAACAAADGRRLLMTAGGRRIPEAVIERDYVLAWLLNGLAGHPLRDVLAFKGGTFGAAM
jgi:uncharacterized protein